MKILSPSIDLQLSENKGYGVGQVKKLINFVWY